MTETFPEEWVLRRVWALWGCSAPYNLQAAMVLYHDRLPFRALCTAITAPAETAPIDDATELLARIYDATNWNSDASMIRAGDLTAPTHCRIAAIQAFFDEKGWA